jgi:hypothetical protein
VIARLGQEGGVNFIKMEEPPVGQKISRIRDLAGESMRIFGGLGGVYFLEELQRGAVGTMTGFAFPEILVRIYDQFAAGDLAGAAATFDKYCPLIRYEFQPKIGLSLRKYVYRKRGVISSDAIRSPGMRIDPETERELEAVIVRVGLDLDQRGAGHRLRSRRWIWESADDAPWYAPPAKALAWPVPSRWRARVAVTMTARGADVLEAAAQQVRAATGATVTTVAGDITTPEGRALALAACPAPDILVTNAGGPKPGDFREWSREDWIAAIDANMLTPIALIKATVDGMMQRGFDHRQHHLRCGEGAHRHPRFVQWRTFRPDRLRRRPGQDDRGPQRDHQQLAAGSFRDWRLLATAAASARGSGKSAEDVLAARRAANPAAASASRPNSAAPVPGCAAPRQVLSPDKTCS